MIESTKDRIIDVSIDLFSKYGYAETSIRDIAQKVEIKTSSIYYHFESKEAILDYILNTYIKIIGESKHRRNWYARREAIIEGKSKLSAKEIMDFLFFEFDEQNKEKYRKMVKIICSESVRNDAVRCYLRNSIELSLNYIHAALDDLQKSEKIVKIDTAKLARVLYSIAFAFMHLDSIDMLDMRQNSMEMDMFSLIEYVLRTVVDGTL